ncbi:unnamed protein product [Calypogeia fissa]
MNGKKDASAASESRPLKRSREEEETEKAEEEEGLVALVKKRRSDVKLLEDRISTLRNELDAARTKLGAAESLLQSMQGGSARSEDRSKREVSESGHRHENGNGKGDTKLGTPNGSRPGSLPSSHHGRSSEKAQARDTADANRSPPLKSRLDDSGGREKIASEGDRRDRRRSDEHENPAGPRLSKSSREKVPSEADRRDRKPQERTSGSETEQKVTKSSTQPRQPEHTDLIMTIKSKPKAQRVNFFTPVYTASQHRRKMRNLVLNPASENQCATSALDGVINFWQIHSKGLDVNFRYTVDCLSPGQRHWPEDLTWHPDGHSLFACYTADNGDSQVAIIKNDNKQKSVNFLPAKPHVKGILNGITFMPWSSSLFVTGGSDHMVQLWREQKEEDLWKPKLLHASLHTSAVHGVAGMRHKQLVLSAGADKRVIGFDPVANRGVLRHDLESKAMTVLPNTVDFNLFMVQTGQPNKQLHLFDIRSRTELHTFGWQQESSDTQSTLITQSWSPDGFYTASGSADPKIVIFDIRYNGREPAQTIYAHTKRVFMAVWHQTLPLMLSISSDLAIGVHRISGK